MPFLDILSQYRTYISMVRDISVLGTCKQLIECQGKHALSNGEVDMLLLFYALFSSVLYSSAPKHVSMQVKVN